MNKEQKLLNSFRLAKTDIARLQRQMDVLSATQQRLMEMMDTLRDSQLKISQKVRVTEVKKAKPVKKVVKKTIKKKTVKKITKRKLTKFVAAKTGKKFHIEACPFAKNIKPKHKVKFQSKTKALNEGYKPCNCVKK